MQRASATELPVPKNICEEDLQTKITSFLAKPEQGFYLPTHIEQLLIRGMNDDS